MTTALPPEADKTQPRLMLAYEGMNIFDAREKIRVVLNEKTPSGVRACLKDQGFKPVQAMVWERPSSPAAIFSAQLIAQTFYQENSNG